MSAKLETAFEQIPTGYLEDNVWRLCPPCRGFVDQIIFLGRLLFNSVPHVDISFTAEPLTQLYSCLY